MVAVNYIIVFPEGVLVEERHERRFMRNGAAYGLLYPGGKLEPGETEEEGFVREMEEETGCIALSYTRIPLLAPNRCYRNPWGYEAIPFLVHGYEGLVPSCSRDNEDNIFHIVPFEQMMASPDESIVYMTEGILAAMDLQRALNNA